MHTYYSALPFTPHNTCLYHLYKQETSHSITVLQSLDATWTSYLSSVPTSGHIQSISPDGTWLAVCSKVRSIEILDARTTAYQCSIPDMSNTDCLAFSPSESTLATVNCKRLELWNTTTGNHQKTQTLRGTYFYAIAFSLRGQYLLLSIDQSLHLHDGTNTSQLSVLSTDWSHTNIIFTSNDTQVITGSEEGHIHFFRLSRNQLSEIRERRIFNETGVLGLVLRHDRKRLVSSGEDGTIRIYDLPSGLRIATLRWPESSTRIRHIAYHPTMEELAVGQGDCVVLWRQKETTSDWVPSIHSRSGHHSRCITGIAYYENGTRMYTVAEYGPIKIWATTTVQVQEVPKHGDSVSCYAVNHPTLLLATGSTDNSIIVWKFTTGDHWRTLLGHTGSILSLKFSDDGVLLASGSNDRTARVWDVATGSLLHQLGPGDDCVKVLAFNEDNAHLTTKSFRDFSADSVWELKSGKLLKQRYSLDDETHTRPYYLSEFDGWHDVVEASNGRRHCKYKYLLCRSPGGYQTSIQCNPIVGERAAILCNDGRVLILDISRVMHHWMEPNRENVGLSADYTSAGGNFWDK